MSIQKKSLISTLKTAKKANVASATTHEDAKGAKVSSMKVSSYKQFKSPAAITLKSTKKSFRAFKTIA